MRSCQVKVIMCMLLTHTGKKRESNNNMIKKKANCCFSISAQYVQQSKKSYGIDSKTDTLSI